MGPINKIMAAIDFSEYSKATLKYAAYLASSVKATLVVANVINHRDVEAIRAVEDENLGLSAEKFIARQKQDRETEIHHLLNESSCQDLNVVRIFRVGVPWVELLEIVKDQAHQLRQSQCRGPHSGARETPRAAGDHAERGGQSSHAGCSLL